MLILTGVAVNTHASEGGAGHSDARAAAQKITQKMGKSVFASAELTMPLNPNPPVKDVQADLQRLIEIDAAAVGLYDYPVKVSIIDAHSHGTTHEFTLATDDQHFCLRVDETGPGVPKTADDDPSLVYGYEIPISPALSDGLCM
ncbi:hypothetical protein ACIRRA_34795 [Nocardia sp. NPDC101769]|uniref:hypothetical protein n=1 Tax=Nocardia sp. NPDC101769 TaxID=3364333 RepID=UPI00381CC578